MKSLLDIEKPIGERKSNADKLFSYTKLKHDNRRDQNSGSSRMSSVDYVKENDMKVSMKDSIYILFLVVYVIVYNLPLLSMECNDHSFLNIVTF